MVHVRSDISLASPVTGVPEPTMAYVLFDDGRGYCAATRHRVANGKLGVGTVISLKRLAEQLKSAAGDERPTLLPTNVLVCTQDLLMWFTPSRKRPMWFHVSGRNQGFHVNWPNLLWIADVRRRQLRVFATGRVGRPRPETPIYHAPLMNINSQGLLCEGSAHMPNRMCVETIPDMESCVFDSCFTHVNHSQTLSGGADNRQHVRYWRSKERTRELVRVRELARSGCLEDILR